MYKIKDGLHELGVMGKKGESEVRGQIFFDVYEGMIHTNFQRTKRKLSIKTFQEHPHLTFSERFCASRGKPTVLMLLARGFCCILWQRPHIICNGMGGGGAGEPTYSTKRSKKEGGGAKKLPPNSPPLPPTLLSCTCNVSRR